MRYNIKSIVAKCLGAFWILDGLLQLQPNMFRVDFINNVLAPNLGGQPGFLHALITYGIHVFSANIPLANAASAAIQLVIGILLLFPAAGKKFKAGLYISIVWGLIVWIFGEGAGSLLTGMASFYTGAPGSVLIYVLLAVLLLMPEKGGIRQFIKIAGWIFIIFGLLQIQPMFWASGGASSVTQAAAGDTVNVISGLATRLSNLFSAHNAAANIVLLILPVILGLALIFKPTRLTASLAVVFLFFVWWVGQDFGALTTVAAATSTDPNTAPILALLILPAFFVVNANAGA